MKKPEKKQNNKKQDNFYLFYALSTGMQLGFFIIVPIGLSIFIGLWLDDYFQLKPILLLTSVFIGIFITIYEVYILLKPILNAKNKK